MRRLGVVFATAAVALSSGCPERHQSIDLTYLCDPSTSSRCGKENIRQGLAPFIRHPTVGSHARVITVGCGSDDADLLYEVFVPDHWGPGANERKRMWSEAEWRHLSTLRLRRPQSCSGIVGAISRAARMSQQSGREQRRLLLDTDLREASEETGFNFERSIPTAAEFVDAVKRRGLLPDLRGVELVVCDVHGDSSPNARRWSAKQSTALRAAWSAYFAEAGAGNVDFLERCPWQESVEGDTALSGGR